MTELLVRKRNDGVDDAKPRKEYPDKGILRRSSDAEEIILGVTFADKSSQN